MSNKVSEILLENLSVIATLLSILITIFSVIISFIVYRRSYNIRRKKKADLKARYEAAKRTQLIAEESLFKARLKQKEIYKISRISEIENLELAEVRKLIKALEKHNAENG